MFHKEVQITDAIIAVILVEASLQGDSSLLALNDMNGDFPENPSVFQSALNMVVLEKLDLMHLLQIDDEGDKSLESVSSALDGSHSGSEEIGKKIIYSDSETSLEEQQSEVESQRKRNNLVVSNENRFSDDEDNSQIFKTQNHNTRCSNIKNNSQSSISSDETDTNCEVLHKNPTDVGQNKQPSNVTKKLELFRFKPREVDVSDNNAVDINQMLNMLPSVAGDFNVDEMDLADIDISQQSVISDD